MDMLVGVEFVPSFPGAAVDRRMEVEVVRQL